MADPSVLLKDLTDEFQSYQKDLENAVQARQKLESQHQENLNVQKEFESLQDTANIYKLIGPVLVKQDKPEAVMNVNKRLEFIESEIKRIETQLADLQEKSEKKKIEIYTLQSQIQQGQQAQGQAIAAK